VCQECTGSEKRQWKGSSLPLSSANCTLSPEYQRSLCTLFFHLQLKNNFGGLFSGDFQDCKKIFFTVSEKKKAALLYGLNRMGVFYFV